MPVDHEDYKVIADLTDHIADASAHHVRYSDAEVRAAINDIFGADGKADADIDLDSHDLLNVGSVGCGAIASGPITVSQTSNDEGFKVQGLGGLVTKYLKFYVSAPWGNPILYASKNLYLQSGEGKVYLSSSSLCFDEDNVGVSFGSGQDYTFFYVSADNTLRLVDGFNRNLNIRLSLDPSGNFDFVSHNAATIGIKLAGTLVTVSAAELNFLKNVSYGVDDSGGAGFKLLRVPN